MKIAFYKAGFKRFFDFVIILASRSRYSHCEIIFSDGLCASASPRDNGVRFKKIDLDSGHWDIVDLSRYHFDEAEVRQWFIDHANQAYDWRGAIGSAFNLKLISDNKKFCSQACAYALGLNLVTTPAKLHKFLTKSRYFDKYSKEG